MKIDLPYIQAYRDRHGKQRIYFRIGKGRRLPMKGAPGSREFMECYWEALETLPAEAPVTVTANTENRWSRPIVTPRAAMTQARKAQKTGGAIYFVQAEATSDVKIGFSTNIQKRIKALVTGSSSGLVLLGAMPGTVFDEKALHKRFSQHRLQGEWFRNHPEVMGYINEIVAVKGIVARVRPLVF